MTIKTTRRNYVFTVQKRVAGSWERVSDALFQKRSSARECASELNNVAGITGRGPNRRYRVRKMVIAS